MSFPSRFALWLLIHRWSLPLSFLSGSRMHDGPRGFAFNNIPMHRISESHQATLPSSSPEPVRRGLGEPFVLRVSSGPFRQCPRLAGMLCSGMHCS